MKILITGGTGLIGRRLADHLLEHGHRPVIVSRKAVRPFELPTDIGFVQWDGKTARNWAAELDGADAVVNLAGAGIADKRWSAARKQLLVASRVDAGRAVTQAIAAAGRKPAVLVQASAIGYYGPQQDNPVTESDPPDSDFMADVCVQWEASTATVPEMGVRRVTARIGVVLDETGGALPKMAAPFRFFAGGPLGSGKQWVSWIHRLDVVRAIRFLIENDAAAGPVNLTAPAPARNAEMARAIGRVLNRPALAPAPAPALRLALGEMSAVVLQGQRVLPDRLQSLGFEFHFPELEPALRHLLGGGSASGKS